jgi:hypothetical protein
MKFTLSWLEDHLDTEASLDQRPVGWVEPARPNSPGAVGSIPAEKPGATQPTAKRSSTSCDSR